MIVEMGNPTPHNVDHDQPVVYYWADPNPDTPPVPDDHANGKDALLRALQSVITRDIPEAFLSVVRDWPSHCDQNPTWVQSDDVNLAQMLSEAYGCPVGRPEDVEQTHHTYAGPPGVGPVEG